MFKGNKKEVKVSNVTVIPGAQETNVNKIKEI
jgi:hypothetical protein